MNTIYINCGEVPPDYYAKVGIHGFPKVVLPRFGEFVGGWHTWDTAVVGNGVSSIMTFTIRSATIPYFSMGFHRN